MKFMGHELEDLKDATAILRGGTRKMVLQVDLPAKGFPHTPFYFRFYDDTYDASYAREGRYYASGDDSVFDIISIELPKKEKTEYEVFEINNYVDLDVLVSTFDSYGKVEMEDGRRVALYNGTLDTGYEYNITKGDKVHLYPKKLTKLERIEEVVDTFDSKDLEKAMSKIIDILGEE